MSQPQSPIAAMSQSSTQSSAQIVSLQADLSNLRLVPAISISLIGPRKSPYRSARCALWLFVAVHRTVCADFLQLLLRFDFMTSFVFLRRTVLSHGSLRFRARSKQQLFHY